MLSLGCVHQEGVGIPSLNRLDVVSLIKLLRKISLPQIVIVNSTPKHLRAHINQAFVSFVKLTAHVSMVS